MLKATLAALGEHNAQSDAERVRRLLDEYRAGGLATVGVRDTLTALYEDPALLIGVGGVGALLRYRL